VQVISDTGRTIYYNDAVPAKLLPHPAFKKFRSDWIELGEEILDAQPTLRRFQVLPEAGELSWFAQTGRSYRVQTTENLPIPDWTPLGSDVLADLPLMVHPLPPLLPPAAALRLQLLPP
jgi:hypothetical protein